MKRLITFVFVFAGVCCVSCEKKEKEKEEDSSADKKYVVGNYYNKNGIQGVIYKTNGSTGMIISLDETTCAWSNEEVEIDARDFGNGMNNMKKAIAKGISNYPAFAWCNNKNTGDVKGWYLPSVSELEDILQTYKNFQDSLIVYKGTPLDEDGRYWSSTEGSLLDGSAYDAIYTEYCGFTWTGTTRKEEQNKVRAVHSF